MEEFKGIQVRGWTRLPDSNCFPTGYIQSMAGAPSPTNVISIPLTLFAPPFPTHNPTYTDTGRDGTEPLNH